LLAKIHLNKLNGYVDITQPHKLSSDAYSYFNNKLEEGFNECKDNLPNELLAQCRLFYNDQIQFLDFVDGPCITHRDYRPSNVMVNNDRVQGIIDWSSGRASFAEEDFYPLNFGKWTDNEVFKKAFLEGYESIRPVPSYENIMPLLGLNAAIATLGFTFRSGTWKTRNASLYQRKRQFLEQLITNYLDKNS
jgi:Ser/Thr protein kinase RdoA (MazF antagonist)